MTSNLCEICTEWTGPTALGLDKIRHVRCATEAAVRTYAIQFEMPRAGVRERWGLPEPTKLPTFLHRISETGRRD